jgi:hypothetical protein
MIYHVHLLTACTDARSGSSDPHGSAMFGVSDVLKGLSAREPRAVRGRPFGGSVRLLGLHVYFCGIRAAE